jgi:glycosyltransferase involved in cell wall biosynthesis
MPAIHQFVAGFSNGDAISNEACVLRDIFKSWGYTSDIFSEQRRILPELRNQARDISECIPAADGKDVVLLHLSIGSPVNERFAKLVCHKAILYHNVTPPHYFDMVNKQTARDLSRGRSQVEALAGSAQVNLADSQFNASELAELGYANPRVLPLVLNLDRLTEGLDKRITRKYATGRKNILFVGRVAPNKKCEDLLQAFLYFNRFVQPDSQFIQVGSFAGTEPYYYYLLARARDLGIDNVHFAGSVPQAQLNAFYDCADVFLCMSEHEGFCIPVIEAMVHKVPVLAFSAGAVPETLDGAGVLFSEKDYPQIAEMTNRLCMDQDLRTAVIDGQTRRLQRYQQRDLASELQEHLAPLLQS